MRIMRLVQMFSRWVEDAFTEKVAECGG